MTMEMTLMKFSLFQNVENSTLTLGLHHNTKSNISINNGEIISNNLSMAYNEIYHYTCPSIQMPVSNLITIILYAIVCIVGLFGNTLVIYVVLRFSKMQTVTNMYLLNLALADDCFLIGIPFLITTMYYGQWSFGTAMCKAYMVSTSITQFTSSIFLFIMSADRYIAVCHPISSPRFRSPFVSRIVSALAWTASAFFMLPVMLYANTIEKDKGTISCIIEWPKDNVNGSGTTFTVYSLVLGFATPLSLILAFYYLVIRKLKSVGLKTKSKEKKKSHRKVTKLVLTVITVYVLCWLPYWISQVALIHSATVCKSRLEITLFLLVGCLGYSNSAMNPILYAFLSDNFKKSFLKAFTCATGKDINAQLQIDNSLFAKFRRDRKSAERQCSISRTGNIKSLQKNNQPADQISPAIFTAEPLAKTAPETITTPKCSKSTTTKLHIAQPISEMHAFTTGTDAINHQIACTSTTLLIANNGIQPNATDAAPVLHTYL